MNNFEFNTLEKIYFKALDLKIKSSLTLNEDFSKYDFHNEYALIISERRKDKVFDIKKSILSSVVMHDVSDGRIKSIIEKRELERRLIRDILPFVEIDKTERERVAREIERLREKISASTPFARDYWQKKYNQWLITKDKDELTKDEIYKRNLIIAENRVVAARFQRLLNKKSQQQIILNNSLNVRYNERA